MANPQQPELARSRKVPGLDPDATETVLSASGQAPFDPATGPVPEDNLPGHHPEHDQDKPVEAFVARARQLAAEAQAEHEDLDPSGADRQDQDQSGAEAVESHVARSDFGMADIPAPASSSPGTPPDAGSSYPPAGPLGAPTPLVGEEHGSDGQSETRVSPLARRVSGVATVPLRVAGRVLGRLRDRL